MLLRAFMLFSAPALVGTACAFGHPGHAVEVVDPQTLSHYALHPDHLIGWIVASAAVASVWLMARAARRRPAPAYARARKVR
ncbi:MAG: hypothetical protein ACTHK7_11175 [Aureliella sp.]